MLEAEQSYLRENRSAMMRHRDRWAGSPAPVVGLFYLQPANSEQKPFRFKFCSQRQLLE
jgi:hypothetical protein